MTGIAESGSTKTNWVFLHEGKKYTYSTVGINPYYQDSESIYLDIKKNLLKNVDFHDAPDQIFFYGAGILEDKKDTVLKGLKRAFPYTQHFVHSDLLGAARALFKEKEGIACICGTGSNSGYYNGKEILETVPSLGLYLGDEGSGGYMGKMLLAAYLRNLLPEEIKKRFENMYKERAEDIMEAIYRKSFPNRYMASFAPFLAENQEHPFIKVIIEENFRKFFKNCLSRYEYYREVPIAFTGSVSLIFVNILEEVAKEFNCKISKVVGDPMQDLLEFHLSDIK